MSTRLSSQLTHDPTNAGDLQLMKHRRTIRYFAATLSAVVAVIYFLIGFRVVTVLDNPENQSFGIAAGLAYALGFVLLVTFDRRTLWILGATFQMVVIFTYFDVASVRIPSFEIWGIVLRIVQVVILVTLLYLEVRRPLPPPEKPLEDEF
jgi:hypothetical protein